jgi:hypothetical protein
MLKKRKTANAKRIPQTHNVGDKVLLKKGTENKYESPFVLSPKQMRMVQAK